MEAQWYGPPAVGYTLDSSAMLAAEHPSANRTTRMPYTTVTLPPDSRLTVKVAARPTQLLQILYPTEMMPKGPIVFSNSCSKPRLARLTCVVEGWRTSKGFELSAGAACIRYSTAYLLSLCQPLHLSVRTSARNRVIDEPRDAGSTSSFGACLAMGLFVASKDIVSYTSAPGQIATIRSGVLSLARA
jgi:hypothetical protein